jgi:hypothetical protein
MSMQQIDLNNAPSDFYQNRVVFKFKPGGQGSYGPAMVISAPKDQTITELKVSLAKSSDYDPDIKRIIDNNEVEDKIILAYVDLQNGKRFKLDDQAKVHEMINVGETIEMSMKGPNFRIVE